MKISHFVCASALAVFATAGMAGPANNVSHHRHPNLAAAQHLATEAYNHVVAAQRDNEFDLGGHAAKAKELLEQATNELKQAAEASNTNHH